MTLGYALGPDIPNEVSGPRAGPAEGELGPVHQKLVPVSLRAGEEGVAGDQLVEIDVDLGPGLHHVAVAVRDGLGGETSYLGQELRVPATAVAATVRKD